VFVLKERVNGARWIAIGVGMAGVLVVLRPTGAGFLTLGGLAVLVAAVCYASPPWPDGCWRAATAASR
jgi:drug/metabolite transporter (DMT)-like permease